MNANVITKQKTPNVNRLKIAHNALKSFKAVNLKFFVEDVNIFNDQIEVCYIDENILNSGEFNNDDFQTGTISLANLKAFVNSAELNIYTRDSSDHEGNHVQVSGAVPLEIYLDECLRDAVKQYLEAGKEISRD